MYENHRDNLFYCTYDFILFYTDDFYTDDLKFHTDNLFYCTYDFILFYTDDYHTDVFLGHSDNYKKYADDFIFFIPTIYIHVILYPIPMIFFC